MSTQSLPNVYPKSTQSLPKVCPKSTQSLPRLQRLQPAQKGGLDASFRGFQCAPTTGHARGAGFRWARRGLKMGAPGVPGGRFTPTRSVPAIRGNRLWTPGRPRRSDFAHPCTPFCRAWGTSEEENLRSSQTKCLTLRRRKSFRLRRRKILFFLRTPTALRAWGDFRKFDVTP